MTAPYKTWTVEQLEEALSRPISDLGVSVRTINALDGRGIIFIRDLLHMTKRELLLIPNFGEKTYAEVMNALRKVGFY